MAARIGGRVGRCATLALAACGVRSAAWIAAEHANQSAPGAFYVVGPEQPAAP